MPSKTTPHPKLAYIVEDSGTTHSCDYSDLTENRLSTELVGLGDIFIVTNCEQGGVMFMQATSRKDNGGWNLEALSFAKEDDDG